MGKQKDLQRVTCTYFRTIYCLLVLYNTGYVNAMQVRMEIGEWKRGETPLPQPYHFFQQFKVYINLIEIR